VKLILTVLGVTFVLAIGIYFVVAAVLYWRDVHRKP